jgi:regulator of replication initiation timing
MFFVTILLNEMIAWMRNQTGTTSLRALLYMDEIFGYFPPTRNPPSKTPMLTLLKQARAYGLGIVLATQNPVDLDYKGLSNAGTWFLGRLQTERDKKRVMEGLEGASAAAGATFDRQKTERILAGLGNRVFLMNNVHEDQPVVFQSRWALSYLRGPINRDQIAVLMADKKATAEQSRNKSRETAVLGATPGATRPVLAPGVDETFLPFKGPVTANTKLLYRPGLFACTRIHFAQASSEVDHTHDISFLLPWVEELSPTVWDTAIVSLEEPELELNPDGSGLFADLPGELNRAKSYTELNSALKNHVYRTQRLKLWRSADLKETSRVDETEGDFRVRISQLVKEQRDLQVEKLRDKYAPKLTTLQEQMRRAQQRVEKEKSQATQSTLSAVLQMGATVFGAMFGRKMVSASNISKAVTSARAAGRVAGERRDVALAEETVEAIQQRWSDLNAQFQEEAARIVTEVNPDRLQLDEITVSPKKADIIVTKLLLCWVPWTADSSGNAESAY